MNLMVAIFSELTENITSVTIYAQSNVNGDKYMLSDPFIHYRISNKTVELSDQMFVIKGRKAIKMSTVK